MRLTLISLALISGVATAAAPIKNISNDQIVNEITKLKRLIQARGAAQVNLQQQISELQEEVSGLRGETETHAHKLEQIVNRQRELYIEIERRLSSIQDNQAAEPQQQELTTVEASYGASLSENEAYDQAVNLILKERKYDDAIPEFQRFISSFPDSVYSANAHYWLGQLLFNKAQYQDSKIHFEKVVRFYPDSTKRSDALLKLGYSLLNLQQTAAAKQAFEQVLSEYPDSSAAPSARAKLAGMN